MTTKDDTNEGARRATALLSGLRDSIAERVIGKEAAVELLLTALLCEGHVLLEDVPGTGKTLLARALARGLGARFRRIQFTPDLLPSDVTGSSIFDPVARGFEFRPGPLFAQIVLADEINRATPRTQSALLEAMEERQVTADGKTMPLERPFLVVATQNPIELEGTFPLPEAQLDRFFVQLALGYPGEDEERAILARSDALAVPEERPPALAVADVAFLQQHAAKVHVSDAVQRYLVALVRRTREADGVQLGAGPRASVALYRGARALACVRGRSFVLPDDVKHLAGPVLAHRLSLTPEARLAGRNQREVIDRVLAQVPVPVEPGDA